jgi:predicted transcriptional regulator
VARHLRVEVPGAIYQRAVAKELGLGSVAAVSLLIRRCKDRAAEDRSLQRRLKKMEKELAELLQPNHVRR